MGKHDAKQDPTQAVKEQIEKNSRASLDALSGTAGANVETISEERNSYEDKYLRAAAEIQNMNTRFNKERAQLLHFDGQKVITSILPVLDNLERALQVEVTDANAVQLKKGVEMVFEHLNQALKEANVTEIKSLGVKFDPTVHQAVQTVAADADHPKDTVVSVLQRGYKLHERVLRPAMVVVAN
ncbi:nucleotide exchange factor GrpE [Lacticaseibacillus pabuli]|uniref:Protein GrpE n=1 Tax=Lacticaseibacillus pabuli TaxID=3025672 RepID=A0ABY7WX86_9LACO|nr:nucleotide exchange factor GrpE [Lacticaseibacillus sp. KACC 23028]WDF83750.1 nucleotide exchange factor GrpE [Lacticaseibacillus sp. KACC 23028]